MALWLAKEFDWNTGRYTGNYYDIAKAGIVAVFVDSFYGNDASAGTAAAPFKTLGKAITTLNSTGANGSRIFMNGVFTENLPAQTYWYEFIGCGGGWNGRTVFSRNSVSNIRIIFTKDLHKYHNIRFLQYNLSDVVIANNTNVNDLYFVNCFLKNILASNINGHGKRYWCFYSVLIDCNLFGVTINSLNGRFNIIINVNMSNNRVLNSSDSYILNSIFNSGAGVNNIVGQEAQFINPSNSDFNVRITSPLIGGGSVDEITGIAANVGGVQVGLPYNGISPEFTTEGGATITDLTIDTSGKFTITSPATRGTLETATLDLGNIYPLENIDLFNVFDFLSGEITQGVFETFSSPRMALTIKLKYGLTSAEVAGCPWLLIEYGKQPTFSGIGASRVGNAADTFDPDTFQTITCRYMKLFITLQNNS